MCSAQVPPRKAPRRHSTLLPMPSRTAPAHPPNSSILSHTRSLPAGAVTASDKEDRSSPEGAVERQVRSALEPTPPHTTPRPFPRTRNPNRSPRTPLLPHFHTHSMAFACAAGEEKCLAYMITKASRDVTFTSQDPTVDILFKPR